jgi:outer membrane protein with beta-barrel domain
MRKIWCLGVLFLGSAFTFGAPAAHAASGSLEFYGGIYEPSGDALDSENTYGLRGAVGLSDRFALEASAGYFKSEVDTVDINLTLLDLSLKTYLNPAGKAKFFLFAGPGWAFVSVNLNGHHLDFLDDDSFTAHAGVGAEIPLGEHVYLRPEGRGRWFENGNDDLDYEVTLAVGFHLGN